MITNISWGTKIAALYVGFVLLIIIMVSFAMRQKVELVNEDYYARELNFQKQITEMNNANALAEKVTHQIIGNTIKIKFPEVFKNKALEGSIEFYRPSDKSKDFKSAVQLNNRLEQSIDLKNLSKGMYKLKIDWKTGKTGYFIEETVVIP